MKIIAFFRDGILSRAAWGLFAITLLMMFAETASAAIGIDVTSSTDRSSRSTTIASSAFSTASGNELLLAFISADSASKASTTVTRISGGSLTWVLVVRTNAQRGDAEIWRAFSPNPLNNVTVTATLSQSVAASMTIMSFTGADASGTYGSGAIGATGSANARSGAPTVSLITSRANSWVFGVGDDFDNAVPRTLGPDQTMVHQYLATVGDTYWVQSQTNTTPFSGTTVTINDMAPTSDRYNLSIVEILAAVGAGSGPATIAATAGTSQSATIKTAFATALQATMKDASNNPVSGVTVTFAAPGSGASGTFAGGVNTATTNSSGVATAQAFTANTTAGSYTVTASVSGVATSASFSLTNTPGPPASIAATAGTPQNAVVGTAFTTALQATVKDISNNPVSGVTVTFAAPGSGASGTFGGPASVTTNSSGVATAPAFTANTVAGSYTATASVSGVATSASFSLTNTSVPPASIAATAGASQNATIGTAFATALQATVKDAGNNPVSGVTVTFTAPGSGASGTFAGGVNTATTNSSGVATAQAFTANTVAGGYTITASVSGVSTPASFSLTNNAGPAASVTATTGTPQSATIGTAFATALQATVQDASNNPVSGVTVTFAAPGSGASGTFAGGVNTATTNSSGVATAPAFTANATAGSYTVTASVSGVSTPASFSLRNNSDPGNSVGQTLFTTQTPALVGQRDGTTVNYELGTLFQSNTSGQITAIRFWKDSKETGTHTGHIWSSMGALLASVTFSNETASGWQQQALTTPLSIAASTTYVVSVNTGNTYYVATNNGLSSQVVNGNLSSVVGNNGVYGATGTFPTNSWQSSNYFRDITFSVTSASGSPASITATAGTPQSATMNTAFATALQATVKDAGNNPVSGVTVTFAAPGSGASGTFGGSASVTTNSSGVATAPAFTANITAGSYTVTASVSGVATSASFSLTNDPGPAASVTATAGTPQSATVNTAFATALQATVKDAGNNPVSGVIVTFAAPGTGASGTFEGSATVATDSSGVATAPAFTANAVAGSYAVTANVSGVNTPASFSLTNNPVILGDSNLESLTDAVSLGQAQAVKAIATATGSVNSLTVYLDSTSAASQIGVGIYADNSGHPGALLGQGNLGQGGSSKLPAGWNSIAISTGDASAPNVPVNIGTTYWIAMLGTQGGTPVYRAAANIPCFTENSSETSLVVLPTQWTTGPSASACPVSIFGMLNLDISGTISGIPSGGGPTVVSLSGPAGVTTIADASGNYSFSVLANNIYTVTPSDAGYTFTPANQTVNVNSSNVAGVDFTALYSISGNVAGLAGITVYLGGPTSASTTTDSTGNYSFTGMANGATYTITPSDIGYIFGPTQQPITINGANVSGVNFTANAAPPAYSISGKITLSSLGVGGGSTVTLSVASTGAIVTSTTADSSGNFTLAGIPNGAYVVTPSSQAAIFTPASLDVTINGASYTAANFTAAGLVFYDDFTGSSLSSDWTVISRHGEYDQNETECNVPEMVSVANSNVTITSEQTPSPDTQKLGTCGDFNIDGSVRHAPSSWPYITGDIQWTSKNFTYGTVEIRAKFPSSATSLWPATWLLNSGCQLTNIYTADTGYLTCPPNGTSPYTEVDMTECYGYYWCQFHVANPSFGIGNGCDAVYSNAGPPVDTNYHIFTTEWTPTSIKQYMDGSLVTTCNQKLSQPMFLIIQTQTGGSGGTPNNSNLPADFSIDYVKVTQP
jgi:Domain of unknown function (DUF4082)/Glycosyl hydrolases family 16